MSKKAKEKTFEASVQGFALSVVTPDVVVRNNVDQLVSFIEERVKDYDPAKYDGDADKAKKDRTELNKGAEQVKHVRQAIQNLNPYGEVIEKLASAEKLILSGSDKLSDIVKARENEEKDAKRAVIQTMWDGKDFHLFPLDKVFNPKWLNKTYKITDIEKEIDVIIGRTHGDLKSIEDFGGVDVDALKARYLTDLDLSATMRFGEELERNRELADEELAGRAEREHRERIEEQRREVRIETNQYAKSRATVSLAASALDDEEGGQPPLPPLKEYTITVKVTDALLLGIKGFLTAQGVEYECNELTF